MIAQINKANTFRANIEAEESILGGVLLDPNAIERVASILQPEAFSIPVHQMIYRAALQIHQTGERVDLMSVTTLLADTSQLEIIGGQAKLAQLVDRTVSAVNIDQYAALVIREFLFRKLIQVGHEITQVASEGINPQDILEDVENKIISLTRSYKAGIFERESVTRFKQISKQLERIEDDHDDDPAFKEWELRELASKFNFKSVRDLLNFHAKWLQSRKTKRSVGLQEFWEQNNAPQQWMMRGFIPRKSLNILWGPGGVGKTLLTGSICHKLITGKSWADYPTEHPAEILLIETDQGKNITATQLEVQGFLDCDEEAKSRFRVLSDWNIEEFGVLRRELGEIRKKSPNAPILVVIDSLTSVSAGSIYEENDVKFARPLERLREIAGRFDCSFLLLHHGSKKGEMRGSTAIHNSADQVFKLERVGQEKGVPKDANLTIEKSRFRLEGVYRLNYQPDDRLWELEGRVASIDGIRGSEETIENASAAFQKIYRFLEENRGTRYEVVEIFEAIGLSQTAIRNELTWGISEGLVDHCRKDHPKGGRGPRPRLFFIAGLPQLSNVKTPSIVNKDECDKCDNSNPAQGSGSAVLNKETEELSPPDQVNYHTIVNKGECDKCDNSNPAQGSGSTILNKEAEELSQLSNVKTPSIVNKDECDKCDNSNPAQGSGSTILNKEIQQLSHQENLQISNFPKKPSVINAINVIIPKPAHSNGFSECDNSSEECDKCDNSNPSPGKAFSDLAPNLRDYYSLKAGDVLVELDSNGNPLIFQITNRVSGNMWATNKPSNFVSLADWRSGQVRRPIANDIAISIEQNPTRKWFRWLHRNLEQLQIQAIEILAETNSELVEQCYGWLNPLVLVRDALAALEDLRLTLNDKGKYSHKKFLKTWGSDGELAIQFAEEEDRITVKKGWIKLAGIE